MTSSTHVTPQQQDDIRTIFICIASHLARPVKVFTLVIGAISHLHLFCQRLHSRARMNTTCSHYIFRSIFPHHVCKSLSLHLSNLSLSLFLSLSLSLSFSLSLSLSLSLLLLLSLHLSNLSLSLAVRIPLPSLIRNFGDTLKELNHYDNRPWPPPRCACCQ